MYLSGDPAAIIEAGQPMEFLEASAYLYAVIPYVSPLEADTPGEVPIDISPLPGILMYFDLPVFYILCTHLYL